MEPASRGGDGSAVHVVVRRVTELQGRLAGCGDHRGLLTGD
jgi:hypothetical protein